MIAVCTRFPWTPTVLTLKLIKTRSAPLQIEIQLTHLKMRRRDSREEKEEEASECVVRIHSLTEDLPPFSGLSRERLRRRRRRRRRDEAVRARALRRRHRPPRLQRPARPPEGLLLRRIRRWADLK